MAESSLNQHIAPDFQRDPAGAVNVCDAVYYGDYTHYVLKGGRGSCKSSFASLQIVAGIQENPGTHAVILRKVAENLYDSVYQQMLWAIDILGQRPMWKASKSPMSLTYLRTGQKVLFRGADEPHKIKSIKAQSGYFKFVWFEETDQFDGEEEVRVILQSLMRGGDRFTVFYSYNPPRSVSSWVNSWAATEEPGRLVHHSSYRTVPREWLGDQFFVEAEALQARKPLAYAHEYDGIATGTGGQVFDNVTIRPITDEEIARFDYLYRGLDWGFSVDPTVYIVACYQKAHRRLYIHHEWYAVGAKYAAIAEAIREENVSNKMIACDSAEPRSIAELEDRGLSCNGAKKGPGSVEHGLHWLQDLDEIIIDPHRCPNAAREFTGYEYDRDRHGNFKAQFPDKDNHTIDAVRYALEDVMTVDPEIRYL
jgi:phage terminase large subunit